MSSPEVRSPEPPALVQVVAPRASPRKVQVRVTVAAPTKELVEGVSGVASRTNCSNSALVTVV